MSGDDLTSAAPSMQQSLPESLQQSMETKHAQESDHMDHTPLAMEDGASQKASVPEESMSRAVTCTGPSMQHLLFESMAKQHDQKSGHASIADHKEQSALAMQGGASLQPSMHEESMSGDVTSTASSMQQSRPESFQKSLENQETGHASMADHNMDSRTDSATKDTTAHHPMKDDSVSVASADMIAKQHDHDPWKWNPVR